MKRETPLEQARLFTALVSGDDVLFDITREKLASSFGTVELTSPLYPWTHTKYYEKEMGTDLKRVFLFFEMPARPELLPAVKIMTNELEDFFRKNAGINMPVRPINIDPGYMTLSKVVLASTKNFSHRIYMGNGIYAEVTLQYRDNTYQPLPYTFPDYSSQGYIEFFNMARERLLVKR